MTPADRLAAIAARADSHGVEYPLSGLDEDCRDLVAFAQAVLALCDGTHPRGIYPEDLRRLADEHLGGDRG